MKVQIPPRPMARLARWFIGMLRATLRVRHLNADRLEQLDRKNQNYILAFWHGQLVLMVYARYRKPITVMVSQHRDGELIASTMELFGVDLARGSTTRGGPAALRTMVRLAAAGNNLAFTPDGPRGPRRVAQVGVVAAAQLTGLPVVPVAVVSRRKRMLASWDRMEIPWPFSRVLFWYGEPLWIPRRLDEAQLEGWRSELEMRMNTLCEEGERDFARLWTAAAPASAAITAEGSEHSSTVPRN
jgi:lysophospholipid acyltransferase (LPLAT)-like uncharacterized protein